MEAIGMTKKVWAVKGSDWKTCPECKKQHVQAMENGFDVAGTSTDLFTCYDCGAFYVGFPDREIAEFPRIIEIVILDSMAEKARISRDKSKSLWAAYKKQSAGKEIEA
ncbi:MAG: hypothetical protein CVU68_01760 [Deltaproteobacteria bacterium HGW-Deltaproteobacteria-3]|nr:MAG: hypothetical protein CVU68_01760 [Deltaproteobacteria bacterium HGW-Deltaproteobacteria-3]